MPVLPSAGARSPPRPALPALPTRRFLPGGSTAPASRHGARRGGAAAPEPPGRAAAPQAQRAAGPRGARQGLAGAGAARGEPRHGAAEVSAGGGGGARARGAFISLIP